MLKSTGGVANVTAKDVDNLATSLLRKTGIDDEAIKSGENWLLTFKDVRNQQGKNNDIFNQATKTMVDLATAQARAHGGQVDLSQASNLLGKALNDPIKGVTALQRVGVSLTQAQKDNIKTLVAHGHVLEAQKIILKEVNSQVGGSAEAFGKTLPGQINILRESFKNFTADLFARVVPALTVLVNWVTAHMPQIEATFNAVFNAVAFVISDVLRPAIDAVIPVIRSMVDWVRTNWPQISATALQVFDTVRSVIEGAVHVITVLWDKFGSTILSQLMATWEFVKTYFSGVFKVLQGIFDVFAGIFSGDWSRVWSGIRSIFSGVWLEIQAVVRLAWSTIETILRAGLVVVQALLTGAWNAIKSLTETVWNGLAAVVTSALTSVRNVVMTGVNAVTGAITTGWNAVKNATTSVWNSVVSAITGAVSRVGSAAKAIGAAIVSGASNLAGIVLGVQKWFQSLWGWIKGAAHSAWTFSLSIGGSIIDGIIDGITHAAGKLWGKLKDIGNSAKHYMTLGLAGSPQLFTYYLGQDLVNQLIQGMAKQEPQITAKLGSVAQMIIAQARKFGVDARAALAVAMQEGGLKFGAVGDQGHSFGPFQLNNAGGVISGMDAAKASAFANSLQGIAFAIRSMADAGAAGKTGLDAITAIVRNFERPLDPSSEIAKAVAAYKSLGPQVAAAISSGTPAVSASSLAQIKALGALVQQFAPQIGLEHARGIIAGLVQSTPTLVQQAKQQMLAAVAAQKQALVEAKAGLTTAFQTLISGALAGVDAAFANWKPPSQVLLEKMQLADQIKSLTDSLGPAVQEAETKLAAAFASGNAAAIKQAQADLNAALATAQSQIAGNTADAVAKAQAALAEAQASGDPEAVAKAQADLDQALADQQTAVDKAGQDVNTLIEFNLSQRAAMETRKHNERITQLKKDLTEDLAAIQKNLKDGNISYDTAQKEILKVLAKYMPQIKAAGATSASEFAKGILSGIGEVKRAAAALAAAAVPSGGAAATVAAVARGLGLPGFARGGVVDKPTLAVVGEKGREAIIPLPRGMAPPSAAELLMLEELRKQTAALSTGGESNLTVYDWRGQQVSPNDIALDASR